MTTNERTQDSTTTRYRERVPERFQTTNATQQTAFSIDVPEGTAFYVSVRSLFTTPTESNAGSSEAMAVFRRPTGGNVIRASGNGGLLSPIIQTIGDFLAPSPSVDLTANTSTQQIDVKVTGRTGTTINWYFDIITLRNLD